MTTDHSIFFRLIILINNLELNFRRKIEQIGQMAGLSQDEILQSTRTVCQGLEALKEEHESIKSTLLGSVESLQNDEKKVVEEKSKLLSKNLDSIQLGIEEAHVSILITRNVIF
jgi:kinesin light chain